MKAMSKRSVFRDLQMDPKRITFWTKTGSLFWTRFLLEYVRNRFYTDSTRVLKFLEPDKFLTPEKTVKTSSEQIGANPSVSRNRFYTDSTRVSASNRINS